MANINSKVLFITPDSSWAANALLHLHKSIQGEIVSTGKEGQLAVYKGSFNYVFVDLKVKDNSALEVIRYIHQSHSQIKIFTFSDQVTWDEGNWSEENLKKLGVFSHHMDLKSSEVNSPMSSLGQIKKWTDVKEIDQVERDESEKKMEDAQFTRIPIEEMFENTKAIFDFYIRIGTNRYIKIVNKGEKGSEEQIKRYSSNGAKFLYFLTEDRADFIGYQNEVLAKKIKSGEDSAKIIKNLKTVSDKYIEEVYTVGLQPHLIEEGKAVCDNVYQFTQRDSNLRKLFSQLEEFNPVAYSHSFLVCFFSTLISQNLEWIGSKTREALSLGAMFHDIGLIQIPETITNKKIDEMTIEEKILFQTHPEKGRDSLSNVPLMTRSTVEIIAQHHEVSDGTGFPYGLSGSKIFPMAKVVGLADAFAGLIVEREVSPLEGLKEFLNQRENLTKYEPDLLKNLIKGFIPEKKK